MSKPARCSPKPLHGADSYSIGPPGPAAESALATLVRRYHDATPSSPGDLGSSSGVLRRISTDMISKSARYVPIGPVHGFWGKGDGTRTLGRRAHTAAPSSPGGLGSSAGASQCIAPHMMSRPARCSPIPMYGADLYGRTTPRGPAAGTARTPVGGGPRRHTVVTG